MIAIPDVFIACEAEEMICDALLDADSRIDSEPSQIYVSADRVEINVAASRSKLREFSGFPFTRSIDYGTSESRVRITRQARHDLLPPNFNDWWDRSSDHIPVTVRIKIATNDDDQII